MAGRAAPAHAATPTPAGSRLPPEGLRSGRLPSSRRGPRRIAGRLRVRIEVRPAPRAHGPARRRTEDGRPTVRSPAHRRTPGEPTRAPADRSPVRRRTPDALRRSGDALPWRRRAPRHRGPVDPRRASHPRTPRGYRCHGNDPHATPSRSPADPIGACHPTSRDRRRPHGAVDLRRRRHAIPRRRCPGRRSSAARRSASRCPSLPARPIRTRPAQRRRACPTSRHQAGIHRIRRNATRTHSPVGLRSPWPAAGHRAANGRRRTRPDRMARNACRRLRTSSTAPSGGPRTRRDPLRPWTSARRPCSSSLDRRSRRTRATATRPPGRRSSAGAIPPRRLRCAGGRPVLRLSCCPLTPRARPLSSRLPSWSHATRSHSGRR